MRQVHSTVNQALHSSIKKSFSVWIKNRFKINFVLEMKSEDSRITKSTRWSDKKPLCASEITKQFIIISFAYNYSHPAKL